MLVVSAPIQGQKKYFNIVILILLYKFGANSLFHVTRSYDSICKIFYK